MVKTSFRRYSNLNLFDDYKINHLSKSITKKFNVNFNVKINFVQLQ